MLSYNRIKDKSRILRACTSLDMEEFEELLVAFQKAWQTYIQNNYINGKKRQREYGGGRKPTLLTIEDKLFFILFYFKTYPLQAVIAFLFGMSQSQANEWIHTLSEVLKMALGEDGHLPERDPQALKDVLKENPILAFIIDGAERRRQRPKDKEEQKKYYSGKKKAHTYKNNVIANRNNRKVEYLSQTYEGKKHDKKICDEENYSFPQNSILFQDTGFQGYEPEGAITCQPKKKPRGKELTADDKIINSVISGIRIIVEHVISGIKRCRIVKDVFRNTKKKFEDLVMEIACGLHNFRVEYR